MTVIEKISQEKQIQFNLQKAFEEQKAFKKIIEYLNSQTMENKK